MGERRSATADKNKGGMTALASAGAAAGGRGSGTSSWPSMRRPPADDANRAASVPGIMNYVSKETTEISTRRDLGGSDSALLGAIWEPTTVRVANARLLDGEERMTLDGNGFELWPYPKGEVARELDFCRQEHVVEEYYPMCEQLVRDAMNSQRQSSTNSPIACVCAFDHNVRSSDRGSVGKIKSKRALDEEEEGEAADPQVQNPAGLVHADYTKASAPRRLNDLSNPPKMNDVLRQKLLSEGRKSLLDPGMVQEALEGKRRYAFVNVWRSIDPDNTVKNPPLACVDATTTFMDDLRTFKIHYVDRVGENYFVCPSMSSERQHGWYYYPDMSMEETLLLKQWDSWGSMRSLASGAESDHGGMSTFTIHSAFVDPSHGAESAPRKSIEVRCVVIWEKEP